MQSMIKRTLGSTGANVASAAYIFLHYSLLVAYIARASGSLASAAGTPMWATAAAFTAAVGGLCFFSSSRVMDIANSSFLGVVILSFLGLVCIAAPGVSLGNLEAGNWEGVIHTLPVVALAFVYQNIVPVVVSSLEGDVGKIRTAMAVGLAVPLVMFVGWEAAILGSVSPGASLIASFLWLLLCCTNQYVIVVVGTLEIQCLAQSCEAIIHRCVVSFEGSCARA
jgi:tyrosine-specific transport protein